MGEATVDRYLTMEREQAAAMKIVRKCLDHNMGALSTCQLVDLHRKLEGEIAFRKRAAALLERMK